MPKDNRKIWVADSETDPFELGVIPEPFIWGVYNGADYFEFYSTDDFLDFVSAKEAEWGCALAGETGELCNLLKKIIRQAPSDPSVHDLKLMAATEIADIAVYLDLVAARLNVDLAQAIKDKFNEVSERHGHDVFLI